MNFWRKRLEGSEETCGVDGGCSCGGVWVEGVEFFLDMRNFGLV